MASASLGQLTLDLIARIGGFTAPMEQAEREAKKRAKGIKDAADDASSAWSNLGKVAAGAFAGISVAGVFTRVIQETISAQQEQAQLAAVLKSTGEAAGYSQDELNNMADAMERSSTISAGEINQAQTTLLAFTGIVGQEFPRALQAAVDMASRTGMSVVSAAETIGRALDIPSKGLSALSKQGFRFTDDQKKLAEQLESTGHTAEAQGIILSALEESYGGAAQAARDTLGGALTGLQNTISGLLTGSGGSVDAATAAVNALNDALASPAAKTAVEGITVTIGAAAAVITGRLVTSLGASAVAFAAAQKEAIRYQMALAAMQGISTRAAAGITAVSLASRGASAALAALGGPVGIALLAASAIVYFGSSASEAKENTSGLKQEVDYLNASFEGLTKNQAAATLLDVQQQLNEAQLKAIDAGDAIHHYEELLRDFPNDGRVQEWNDSLVRARGEFDSARQVVSALTVKIEQLNGIIERSNIDSAAGQVSKTYKDISSKIEEQILLHGKKTEAEKLEAKINAGLIDGLLKGEGQKLIALQKTRDAQIAQEEAEKKSAQAAEASAAKAKLAAAALKQRFDDAQTGYEGQIALINTEVDKRKDATEVAKLQFEIESGKLVGINDLQQKRLNGLAAELDRLKKLKQANEDAAKSAAYRATLQSELENDQSVLDLDLVGAGMGEKARERLRQDLQIQKHYSDEQKKLAEDYRNGDISKAQLDQGTKDIEEALAQRLKAQHKYYEDTDQAQQEWMKGVDEAFQNYVDTAENHYQIAADAITGILGGATSALSDSIYDVFTGTETLSDALGNLATTIGQTIVKAIADMIAQWLVAQAVQLVFGKTTQASAAAAMTANAQATALQAGLAAFASTAAIPIVGPALAPGAMAAALAVAEPLAAAVSATSLAGMAHDGIDAVPETGTWLLQKGERVTTASTSAKLDKTLSDIQNNQTDNSRSTVINFYQQGGGSSREQQASTAKAARQIARAVDAAGRYS